MFAAIADLCPLTPVACPRISALRYPPFAIVSWLPIFAIAWLLTSPPLPFNFNSQLELLPKSPFAVRRKLWQLSFMTVQGEVTDETSATTATASRLRDDLLHDPRYPVHRVAGDLLPYLRLLVERFRPERVVLFGSYAYGEPTAHSDIDLLVIKRLERSPRAEATAIRKAFQPLRRSGCNLPFDIMVRDPRDLRERLDRGADFHRHILEHGLTVA